MSSDTIAHAMRLREGAPLYPTVGNVEASDVYRYAPWFAWLTVPFTYLPIWLAGAIWSLILVGASVAAVAPLARRGAWIQVAQAPMLDVCCGTGLNLFSMAPGSVGLRPEPEQPRAVQAVPHQTAVEGDIEAMPFEDASFGTVVCAEVLEHIPYPDRALKEILLMLRPGGVLIGSVPAGHSSGGCAYRPGDVRAMLAPGGRRDRSHLVLGLALQRAFRGSPSRIDSPAPIGDTRGL